MLFCTAYSTAKGQSALETFPELRGNSDKRQTVSGWISDEYIENKQRRTKYRRNKKLSRKEGITKCTVYIHTKLQYYKYF